MNPMKFIIIGNGPAGTTAAAKLRKLNTDCSIQIFSQEKTPYYARPKLPDYIAGKTEKVQVYDQHWYQDKNIMLHINSTVQSIDTKKKTITSNGADYKYDSLLLALGATPNMPPVKGANNKNIYTLRTLEDADNIIAAVQDKKEVVVVGGGVLGLEIANSFLSMNKSIKVVEVGDCLLSRQLNTTQGKKLQSVLEDKGVQFYLPEMCDEISKINNKLIINTKNNTRIEADIILVSAGVRARIDLPKKAGLDTDKGIIVNEYLQTSHESVFAAGDCIQFSDQLWGFVKSSIEQGNIAAENMINTNSQKYSGTEINVTIKISGIDMNNVLNS